VPAISTGTSLDSADYGSEIAVEIWSPKIEYDLDNQLINIPIPVGKDSVGTKTPYSRVIDLKRIGRAISVQGSLNDDADESATTKRNNLISLLEDKKGLSAIWGSFRSNYLTQFGYSSITKIFINKIKFTETAGIYGEAVEGNPQPFRKIDVQLQLISGKYM